MSLEINPDNVTAVLLVDGWHGVTHRSFGIDSYEYVVPHPDPDSNPLVLLGGGREPLVPAHGFTFTEPDGTPEGTKYSGPLTSIIAVRHE